MAILLVKELKNFDYRKHSEELYKKVEQIKLRERKQIPSNEAYIGFVDQLMNSDFICLKSYKEYGVDGNYFDGDPKKLKKIKNLNGEFNPIIITKEGFVLHGVSKFFHNDDVKNIILSLFKSLGLHNVSIKEVNNFNIKTMRTFYKTAKKIVNITIEDIGNVAPNPHMPEEQIEEAVQDMRKGSSLITLESGRNKNLKESQVIDEGLARRSFLRQVRGKDEDGDTFTISSKGSIIVHLPEEFDKQSTKLHKMIKKIFGILH